MVSLSNYANIFEFYSFSHSLLLTAYYVILNIPIQTAFSLRIAMLLQRKHVCSELILVIALLPFLSTPVSMSVLCNWIFNPSTDIVNQFLAHFGFTELSCLTVQVTAMPVISFANIWEYVCYNMLFFLAALSAIPLS